MRQCRFRLSSVSTTLRSPLTEQILMSNSPKRWAPPLARAYRRNNRTRATRGDLPARYFRSENIKNPVLSLRYKQMHGTRRTMIPHHPLSYPENDLRAKKQRHPFREIDGNYYEKPVSNRTTGENVENAQCNFGPERKLGTVPLETVRGLSAPVMEDWSLEHVETYNPWKVSEMKNIIRRLIGGTKLQRKIFRLAERKRIQALKVAGIIDPSASKEVDYFYSKGRVIKEKYVCTSELIPKMRRLCLQDLDALLQSIDFSKLLIRDVKSTSVEGVHVPELIEKVLMQKFKELLLDHLK